MNDRDIERAAINEILREAKSTEQRNKVSENGLSINKRLLSRNLVSTLRNPIFSRGFKGRQVIGLDEDTDSETDNESDSHEKKWKEDEYIYDARDYFNPKKYREIVAYRNQKHRRIDHQQRKRSRSCCHDSFENNVPTNSQSDEYLRDSWQCETKDDESDCRSSIKYIENDLFSERVTPPLSRAETVSNSRKRSHHKSEKQTKSKKHGKKKSKRTCRDDSDSELGQKHSTERKHKKHKKNKSNKYTHKKKRHKKHYSDNESNNLESRGKEKDKARSSY